MKIGTILFVIFIIVGACKTNKLINPDKVAEIERECNKLREKKFKRLNSCEKISYLHDVDMHRYRMTNEAFVDLLLIMGEETGISPSIVFNIGGGVYPSDTLFDYDMKKWTTNLGCDSIIQIRKIY